MEVITIVAGTYTLYMPWKDGETRDLSTTNHVTEISCLLRSGAGVETSPTVSAVLLTGLNAGYIYSAPCAMTTTGTWQVIWRFVDATTGATDVQFVNVIAT